MFVAGEAVEHAAGQIVLVAAQQLHHLVLPLTTVDHQRQACLYRPLHLLLEGIELLLLELARPIVVQAHLTDSDETVLGFEVLLHLGKHFAPIGSHLLGMQTNHRVGIAGILAADIEDSFRRLDVDGRKEHLAHSCLTGTSHHFGTVCSELLAVQMRMCIYEHFLLVY